MAADALSIAQDFPDVVRVWTNPHLAVDVNGNGQATAHDALLVINAIEKIGSGATLDQSVSELVPADHHVDTNGDGELTATDVLRVINHLSTNDSREALPEGVVAISGTLTTNFTDCVSHQVLSESGEVNEDPALSCDGGSYIIVDGTEIRTSSGLSPLHYDKHTTAEPGAVVRVLADATGTYGLTLDCDSCGVTVLEQ